MRARPDGLAVLLRDPARRADAPSGNRRRRRGRLVGDRPSEDRDRVPRDPPGAERRAPHGAPRRGARRGAVGDRDPPRLPLPRVQRDHGAPSGGLARRRNGARHRRRLPGARDARADPDAPAVRARPTRSTSTRRPAGSSPPAGATRRSRRGWTSELWVADDVVVRYDRAFELIAYEAGASGPVPTPP